jgi:hypothetical protein
MTGGGEDFKLVDGWWTFPRSWSEAGSAQGAENPCKTRQKAGT